MGKKLRTNWLKWENLERHLEIGDLVEFKRGLYEACIVSVVEIESIPVCEAECILRCFVIFLWLL